jgi:hypothetical protein
MNEVEIFPQVSAEAAEVCKIYPDVWKNWKPLVIDEIFKLDKNRKKGPTQRLFQPERVIKDPQDRSQLLKMLSKCYHVFLIIFKHL